MIEKDGFQVLLVLLGAKEGIKAALKANPATRGHFESGRPEASPNSIGKASMSC